MESWVQSETPMSKKKRTKLVREGIYVDEPGGWSPYVSLEDAYRLDDVREALRRGDSRTAAKFSRVYILTPVSA